MTSGRHRVTLIDKRTNKTREEENNNMKQSEEETPHINISIQHSISNKYNIGKHYKAINQKTTCASEIVSKSLDSTVLTHVTSTRDSSKLLVFKSLISFRNWMAVGILMDSCRVHWTWLFINLTDKAIGNCLHVGSY